MSTPARSAWWVLALAAGLAVLAAPIADAKEKWGPFRGQIVDVETGHPIAGAVVLVTWYKMVYAVVQTNEEFFDALEAVTDAEGRFELPRLNAPFFGFQISDPGFSYFAPEYLIHSVVVTPPDGQQFVAPTVIHMRKLKTRKELMAKSREFSSSIPVHKMLHSWRAVNVERALLGLKPLPIPDETKP